MTLRIVPRKAPPLFGSDGKPVVSMFDWMWDRFLEDEQDRADTLAIPDALAEAVDRLPERL